MPAKKMKKDAKDSATKQTLNPPHHGPARKAHSEERDQLERDVDRQVGQFTGEGVPSQVKK
jgi:hypothetical protein